MECLSERLRETPGGRGVDSWRLCDGGPISKIKGDTGMVGREGLVVRSALSSVPKGAMSFFRLVQNEVLRERLAGGVSIETLPLPLLLLLVPIDTPLMRDVVSWGLDAEEPGSLGEDVCANFWELFTRRTGGRTSPGGPEMKATELTSGEGDGDVVATILVRLKPKEACAKVRVDCWTRGGLLPVGSGFAGDALMGGAAKDSAEMGAEAVRDIPTPEGLSRSMSRDIVGVGGRSLSTVNAEALRMPSIEPTSRLPEVLGRAGDDAVPDRFLRLQSGSEKNWVVVWVVLSCV